MLKRALPLPQQAALLGAGLLLAACTGMIGDPDSHTRTRTRSPSTEGASTANAAAVPLARLTRDQYRSTLRDLFAPIELPEVSPPADTSVGGFQGNTAAQTPSPALVEAYQNGARVVAEAALAKRDVLLGCSPGSRAEEDACFARFIAQFGKRAYRRPLASGEIDELTKLHASARASGADFSSALSVVLQAMLQSPHFLYRVEIGTPIEGQASRVRLAPYEIASRLSYLLWNTMPDDALFGAAESGALGTREGVEAETRRLLQDPRTRVGVREFFGEWLKFEAIDKAQKDPIVFPSFGASTVQSMRASAEKFVEETFFGKGTFTALLTDDHAWVDDTLAPIYGVPTTGSTELRLVSVDATQRAGILTNAGLMAGFANTTTDAPVLRGVFVLDRMLCSAPPPPPPGVPPAPPANAADPKTTRQRFEQLHERGVCASCHKSIDPLGFAFGHYDAVGAWRTTENGQPVDATGTLDEMGDLRGSFDGAVQLAQKLANSNIVQTCFASQWTRYALGVDAPGVRAEDLRPIVDTFVAKNLDMRELVVALVTSDLFRTREVVR